jgi:hypothetical protein
LVPVDGFAEPAADVPLAGIVPDAADGGAFPGVGFAAEPAAPASAGGTFVVVGCAFVDDAGSSDWEPAFAGDLSVALVESSAEGFPSSDEAHPKPTALKTPKVPTNIPKRVLLVI